MDKTSKILCIISTSLLVIIAVFHLSGINLISEMVNESDAPQIIKSIFPVLFIIPTLQLIGLATFGLLALSSQNQTSKILWIVAAFVLIDAILAFVLEAHIPGVVLAVPAVLYAVVAWKTK